MARAAAWGADLQMNSPLPGWFVIFRRAIISLYIVAFLACAAGAFFVSAVGVVVYRDFTDYRLYGNPWDPSSFPWYVIWPMRLGSICAGLAIAGIAFTAIFIAIAFIWPARLGSPVVKQIGVAICAVFVELACAAWFGRWFG